MVSASHKAAPKRRRMEPETMTALAAAGASWRALTIETADGQMPARVYGRRAGRGHVPLVLHLHGGAFIGGTLDKGALIAALLAEAGAVVVSADYPLAIEHPFPFALTAALGALTALMGLRPTLAGRGAPLYVAGEEAGGNLAAGLAMMARDQKSPALAGQILVSPMLDPCLGSASVREAEAGPCGCKYADGWQAYLGAPQAAAHPYAAPLTARRLKGLPPALVVSAEDCLLRDDSVRYAAALEAAGVPTQMTLLRAPTDWPEAFAQPLENTAGDTPTAQTPSDPLPYWAGALKVLFSRFFETTGRRRPLPTPSLP